MCGGLSRSIWTGRFDFSATLKRERSLELFILCFEPQFTSLSAFKTKEAVHAVGMFELQIRQWQNSLGILHNGQCCDLQSSRGQRCPQSDQCDTFFRVCLKEYQARVAPLGTCTFGTGVTPVLGGNSHGMHHHGLEAGRIVIPFKYAWPVSPTSLFNQFMNHKLPHI
ncbi:protein jagged-1b isoform X1 [Tachysurus ichikawai]